MADIPPGRRPLERNEHLFIGRRKKCRAHLWIETSLQRSGTVVACAVCGKLKAGETLPVGWEPITRG